MYNADNPYMFDTHDSFWLNTTYTATVTLTAKDDYTFEGVAADTFTYSDYGHVITTPASEYDRLHALGSTINGGDVEVDPGIKNSAGTDSRDIVVTIQFRKTGEELLDQ
jgi:transcriptional antiterminator Rof (Rho-off)